MNGATSNKISGDQSLTPPGSSGSESEGTEKGTSLVHRKQQQTGRTRDSATGRPQPERPTLKIKIDGESEGCGVIVNSWNEDIICNADTASQAERISKSGSYSSPPFLVDATVGKGSKNCIQIEGSGTTRTTINLGSKARDRNQREKQKD
ncbi:hypothetical protein HOY82DRAFT_649168 [Tuber indicum]|nr:hypothetical protein HOY82DRAFT_649168 [Tuber indicum]